MHLPFTLSVNQKVYQKAYKLVYQKPYQIVYQKPYEKETTLNQYTFWLY